MLELFYWAPLLLAVVYLANFARLAVVSSAFAASFSGLFLAVMCLFYHAALADSYATLTANLEQAWAVTLADTITLYNISLFYQPEPSSAGLSFFLSAAVTVPVFLTLLASKPFSVLQQAWACLAVILSAGALFFVSESLILLILAFELLLLSSLYLLRLTSKSERVVDASVEMFFWTLIGSAALLTFFVWLGLSGNYTLADLAAGPHAAPTTALLALFVGFGVKVPVWPFFSWLLKAHVEASVEFSILLSGFIVKVGVYGLYRFLSLLGASAVLQVYLACCGLGIFFATCRLFAQRDLKRIVALTTVIEMNWLGVCLCLGGLVFESIAFFLVVAHSITTSLEFLIVECLSRRYGTRDLTQLSGVFNALPLLGVVAFSTTLITIGFPGTPLFLAKFLFFSALLPVSFWAFALLGLLLALVVPLFFMRAWVPVWFGLSANFGPRSLVDLTSSELGLFALLLLAAVALAWAPGLLWPL